MSDSNDFDKVHGDYPHLVFLPSGIGNLTPFFQLAVTMASHNCKVTFINIQPQAHAPELPRFSSFISNHPRIELLDFEIRSNTHPDSTISDPFIIHIEKMNSSLHLLNPILSSLSVSAIFSDFAIATSLSKISADLNIPHYIVSTTSAKFFSLVAYLPVLTGDDPNIFNDSTGEIEVRGLEPIPKSKIPPSWMDTSPSNYILTNYLLPNARSLSNVEGVLLNTFDWFEHETVAALKGSRAMNNLPPLFPIGPLKSYDPHKTHQVFSWLDQHKAKSVVYVDFGSREVMPTDQTTELAKGLDICGCNYLWANPHNIIIEGTKNKGKIIRGWVDQERVLGHPAIGGFVSQCEWGSVMQAAVNGVPILTWPHHGDQRMNAETVEKAGLGVLIRDWGWIGEKLVEGKEIGRVVKQIMEDLNVRKKAEIVRGKSGEACEIGGSSENGIVEVIEMLMSEKK
ncbi:hypothetical protein BUALT_Bualt04G0140300 [Buddleja alternifolia]|uniref:UDP-glycosyltransferase n=1 Tax=Buddleja alternifolia TaxID=168488 RepID=A0AAV6XZM8_9LAMI|nr:hypothetical protein BUALT_Bualt04G0140300 [Buddleja alternifolia]